MGRQTILNAMAETNIKEGQQGVDPAVESMDNAAFVVVSSRLLSEWKQKAQQTDEMHEKLLRTLADWDNARKRISKEKEEAIKHANTQILQSLLPIIDNFEIGIQSSQKASDINSVLTGVKMVLSQFLQILKEEGVEPIEAVGKPFDPHFHESLGFVETDEVEEGHVASQLRKGYMYKGRLLRAAAVYVAKKPTAPSKEEVSSESKEEAPAQDEKKASD
ncbi:nucleotide exchange factor GrpE [Methylacidiphilum kamchatkense]|uniref:Protein GrpE n=2 Tax=Methylacidiphilum kamchatkense Kam1 TaxID=1202785 RepID=A0A516TPT2_9BACT|nr:nucleotide exchange factor GrpE [Methylacidiphilum kamchatkense]QDQ43257.1 molecular chaperone GrpE [Methylacidiphilum kamchatkense Kam1]